MENLSNQNNIYISCNVELSNCELRDFVINAKICGFHNWVNPKQINDNLKDFCYALGLNIIYTELIPDNLITVSSIQEFYQNLYQYRINNIANSVNYNETIIGYLDDYNLINIYNASNNNNLYIKKDNEVIKLHLFKINDLYSTYIFNGSVIFNSKYILCDHDDNEYPIIVRFITKTNRFEKEYCYDKNDLGVTYTRENTTFKLWAPVSHKVLLLLDNKLYPMNKSKSVYSVTIEGDFDSKLYNYVIYNNDTISVVSDPYGLSSNANSMRSAIINKNKYKSEKLHNFNGSYNDSIIYEISLRDYLQEYNQKSYFIRNSINGLKHNHESIGLDHLVDLGITHVQLMPVLDFATVDEINHTKMYNWGYDPIQYFTLEGSLSSNPNDPYNRILEFKSLIDIYHKHNISVNIDVVFNHVYMLELFSYNLVVPYYFIRYYDTHLSNGSYCGNDLETTSYMMRKYLVDICKYFIEYLDVDGLRFDLMGIIDVDTINAINNELRNIKKNVMLYGEGWNMPTAIDDSIKASENNHYKLDNISFFNDTFRDSLKNLFVEHISLDKLLNCILGNKFKESYKTVNYFECHDNQTIYDYLTSKNQNNIIDKIKILNTIVLISSGISFIHSGQEFGRTKQGIDNTYNVCDDINKVAWSQKIEYNDLYVYTKELIELRKNNRVFRYDKTRCEFKVINNLLYLYIDQFLVVFNLHENEMSIDIDLNYELVLSSKKHIENLILPISVQIYKS